MVCASYKRNIVKEGGSIQIVAVAYLVLLLPLIAFLFKPLYLTLEVFSLDIDLPQSVRGTGALVTAYPASNRYALLHRILEALVCSIKLLLKKLDLPLQTLVDRLALITLLLRSFRGSELALGLLEIAIHHRQLVLQGCDLLVLLQKLLLEFLVLRFRLLGASNCGVRLSAEGLKALLQHA